MVNKEIIDIARASEEDKNKCWSKIPEMQRRWNLCFKASYCNTPFVTILGIDNKSALDIFPYAINKYQSATKCHNAYLQALTNAEASQTKQAKLYSILEP